MTINIDIYSGAGNILAVIDSRGLNLNVQEYADIAKKIKQVESIEGLMTINSSDIYDFTVDFFNPDGSYGAMCGNGARVACAGARLYNIASNNLKSHNFTMAGNIYTADTINENTFAIHFAKPKIENYFRTIVIDGIEYNYSFFDIGGAVHSVFNIDEFSDKENFDKFDLNLFAPKIRFHQDFENSGTNVNVYKFNDDNSISYRTYERGVEAETGACGTGAISVALSIKNRFKHNKIALYPPSKSMLEVEILTDEIILSGSADYLKSIKIEY